MTKKELLNKRKFYFDYLELIRSYRGHFEEKFGKKGLEEEIDRILDSINFLNKKISKLK